MFLRVLNKILNYLIDFPHVVRYLNYQRNISQYDVDSSFFHGEWTKVYGLGKLSVGAGSYCGSRCAFSVSKGYEINIGSNVSISHNVRIYTNNRIAKDITSEKNIVRIRYGNVNIGNNVWIGANVMILEGVSIGDNVVIGANSVVSKNIPSNTVAVGAPIKCINCD